MTRAYSWSFLDAPIAEVVRRIAPSKVLDIGAGEGKYGRLLRSLDVPDVHLTGLEIDPRWRDGLLAAGYNEVLQAGAMALLDSPEQSWDLVILGDVLEHLRKSEGQDLLEFLNYRCGYILIVTPEAMPMQSPHFHEGHNSLWRPESMRWHDFWAHCRAGLMHLYLLRGYIGWHLPALRTVAQAVNDQRLEMPYGLTPTTPIFELALHDAVAHDPAPSGVPGEVVVYRPM